MTTDRRMKSYRADVQYYGYETVVRARSKREARKIALRRAKKHAPIQTCYLELKDAYYFTGW